MKTHINTTSSGFSTIEIMIAYAIMSIALISIILVSFTNQSLGEDSQKMRDMEHVVDTTLSKIKNTEFKLIQPNTSTSSTPYGEYETRITVDSQDFFQKYITVTVSDTSPYRHTYTTRSTLVTDYTNADTSDTCDSVPTGDWTHPEIKNSVTDIATLLGDPTHQYSISDIDTHHHYAYASIGDTDTSTKETFLIFDIHDPTHPQILGKTDNASTTSTGISSFVVSSSTTQVLAYSANASHTTSFATCTQAPNCAQLQVFNITNPLLPTLAFNVKIPSATPPYTLGTGTQATGKSIAYSRGYVYLGLTKTAQGPEFNIFDARDQTQTPVWVGGYTVGYTVYGIQVKNQYAYIVHETSPSAPYQEQLTVLDISDPTHPYRVGGFFAPAGIFNVGKSLHIIGNTLYLGRLASRISGSSDTTPEFIALDISNPDTPPYPIIATTSLAVPESLNALLVRNTDAYFVTSGFFQIWNMSTSSPSLSSQISLPHGGTITPSIDCEGNYIYVGSNTSTNKGNITIISAP